MPFSRAALALAAPAFVVLGSACAESPTSPPRPQLAPATAEPRTSIYTPLLLPPDATWGHYFTSFNPDRALDVSVIQYADGRVGGRGTFVIPGVGSGTLRPTSAQGYGGCVPYGAPCGSPGATDIPESSTSSGDGRMGPSAITFTLDLKSNGWPPEGWQPGADPGTDYDTATLTICPASGACTTTTFYGELHHEPT
jgi:hypothetical protein